MDREREQTWLIAAVVVVGHAAMLVVIAGFWAWHAVEQSAKPRAIVVARAPLVTPAVESPPPETTRLGEATGIGDSIASVDLPERSASDRPDEVNQAWTRQRPKFVAPSQAQERRAAEPASPSAEQKPAAIGPTSVTDLRSLSVPRVAESKPPEAPGDERAPSPEESPAENAATAESQQAAAQPDATPDPAERGESDLDPFAKEEGASFAPGGVSARQGREVKLVRPRIDLAFMADATRMSGRDLVVKLRIESDAAGHPRKVDVVVTSGSSQIDDAVRLAMYDSWFGGKMPDAFPFTVRFVRR